jgi:uncharacterized DUF497 family protein
MSLEFEWDPDKAQANALKHGVDFLTASKVFDDPFALVEADLSNAAEERWRTIGLVRGVLLLLVAHTVREGGEFDVVRIISARRTNPSERRKYEQTRRENSAF